MPTIFTKIINKEIPAKIVFEDEHCLAFRDISPQAPQHILLIPKIEIENLNAVKAEKHSALMGHLLSLVPEIARLEGFADQGYRTVINTGRDGGQSVDHLHIHILGGRAMKWPPG